MTKDVCVIVSLIIVALTIMFGAVRWIIVGKLYSSVDSKITIEKRCSSKEGVKEAFDYCHKIIEDNGYYMLSSEIVSHGGHSFMKVVGQSQLKDHNTK